VPDQLAAAAERAGLHGTLLPDGAGAGSQRCGAASRLGPAIPAPEKDVTRQRDGEVRGSSVPRAFEARGWRCAGSLLGTSHAAARDSPETRKSEKEKFEQTEKRDRGFLICTHKMRAVLQQHCCGAAPRWPTPG